MVLNGAQIIMECLLEQGVDTVFGYPGGAILTIYDALYEYADRIHHVLLTHEQHVAHAADGYARSSGKPGIALSTSGPGATNLLTGLAAAYMDSSPVIAITCNVSKGEIGKDSFQEVDIFGISMPVTKHNFLVRNVHELAPTLRKAFAIATSDRPGPVLIDILSDVTSATCTYSKTSRALRQPVFPSDAISLEGAVDLINESEKPMIMAGGGIVSSGAEDALLSFSDLLSAPVALTLMGIGSFPTSNPRYIGMTGTFGTETAARCLDECDLLIAVGTRFSDRSVPNPDSFAPNAKILHIDIDPAEINKNVRCDLSLIGDAKVTLSYLADKCKRKASNPLLSHLSHISRPAVSGSEAAFPQFVLETLGNLAGRSQLYTTEVGEHQMWAARWLPVMGSRHFITSGGLGSMGFGLGAAIGASIATKSRVINIAGDGSFYMNMAELSTIAFYHLPVIQIVFNNKTLGLVRQLQLEQCGGRLSQVDFSRPTNFTELAASFGIPAKRISRPEEVKPALEEALNANSPYFLEFIVSQDEAIL